jgi:hypothetical protein
VRLGFLRTSKEELGKKWCIKSSQSNIQEYNEIPQNPWQTSGQEPWTRITTHLFSSSGYGTHEAI